MLLQRKKNCILEGICHRKHCWRWLLCSACLVTCQLECCHPHLNASLGRKQVNQGKSALNHRSLFFLSYENWIWYASISLIPLKGKPSEARSICRGQQFLNPKADQQKKPQNSSSLVTGGETSSPAHTAWAGNSLTGTHLSAKVSSLRRFKQPSFSAHCIKSKRPDWTKGLAPFQVSLC